VSSSIELRAFHADDEGHRYADALLAYCRGCKVEKHAGAGMPIVDKCYAGRTEHAVVVGRH
jgi:hypothetical protein